LTDGKRFRPGKRRPPASALRRLTYSTAAFNFAHDNGAGVNVADDIGRPVNHTGLSSTSPTRTSEAVAQHWRTSRYGETDLRSHPLLEFIVVLLISGQTVGRIAAFMRDVTARRNQEIEPRGRITELEGGSSLS
jgi:hypothetical protein